MIVITTVKNVSYSNWLSFLFWTFYKGTTCYTHTYSVKKTTGEVWFKIETLN